MKEEIEKYYQNEAKTIVDMLFDGGIFKEAISRDKMNVIEDYLAWILQTNAHSSARAREMLLRVKKEI